MAKKILGGSTSDLAFFLINNNNARPLSLYSQMKEIAVNGEDEEMVQSPHCAETCDVALFVYDQSNPNSFEYVAELQVGCGKKKALRLGVQFAKGSLSSQFFFSCFFHLQSRLVVPGPQSIFVAAKADRPAAVQEYSEQPAAFCTTRELLAPIPVSTTSVDAGDPEYLFTTVLGLAAAP